MHQWALAVGHGVQGDYFVALKINDDFPAGFWAFWVPVAPFIWPISPFWNSNVYPIPVLPLYLECQHLILLSEAHRWKELISR